MCVAVHTVEDEYRDLDARLAQLNTLFGKRHAKAVDAAFLEPECDGLDAMPIGIGLDDGDDLRLSEVTSDHAEVRGDGLEIDLRARRPQAILRGEEARLENERWRVELHIAEGDRISSAESNLAPFPLPSHPKSSASIGNGRTLQHRCAHTAHGDRAKFMGMLSGGL